MRPEMRTELRARLGINNCFAVKRWPRPGDWAAIVADDLGLDTVELSLDLLAGPDTPAGRDRLKFPKKPLPALELSRAQSRGHCLCRIHRHQHERHRACR